MRSIGESDLMRLIDGIYAASLDFRIWPMLLEQVADAASASDAVFCTTNRDGAAWMIAPRTDPAAVARYEHYSLEDEVRFGVIRAGVGSAVADSMILPRETYLSSRFYNEWSGPLGYRTVLGGLILSEGDWNTIAMLPGQDFSERDLPLLRLLSPHLRRATQINIAMSATMGSGDLTRRLLQLVDAGVLLADAVGRVVYANAIAETWFGPDGCLTLAHGLIGARRPDEADRLGALLEACARGSLTDMGGTIHFASAAGEPVELLVAPIRRPLPLPSAADPVALILGRPKPAATTPLGEVEADARLRERYRLTPAEVAFLREIIKGIGKQATAERRNISYTTARTHLSRILDKTGVNRQAELVRLILEIDGTA